MGITWESHRNHIGGLFMKMSAKEYNSLPSVRNVRGHIRRKARSIGISWGFIDCKSKKKCCKATIKLWDDHGGNILKARRYKGKILNYGKKKNYLK